MLRIDRNYCHPCALRLAIHFDALTPHRVKYSDGGVTTDRPDPSPEQMQQLKEAGWREPHEDAPDPKEWRALNVRAIELWQAIRGSATA